jgi:hypothetical protein
MEVSWENFTVQTTNFLNPTSFAVVQVILNIVVTSKILRKQTPDQSTSFS